MRAVALVALSLLFTPLGAGAERGIVVSRYQLLIEIDLETGERQLLGELGREMSISRLSFSDEGRLFAAGREAGENWLSEIRPEGAQLTLVGRLPAGEIRGLAFDGRGRLWFGVEGELFEIDIETAAAELVATLPEPLRYFSGDGNRLVGFQSLDTRLMALDLETFELISLFDTQRTIGIFDSAFGKSGKLWIAGSAGGILIGTSTVFGRIDLVQETFDRAFHEHVTTSNPEAGMFALAIRPAETVVEIPTLDRQGLVLAAMLLGVLATALLGRRHS